MVVFHNDIINAIAQARNIRHLLASDILERWQQGEEATAEQTQSLIQLGDWIDFLTDAEQLVVEECIDSTDVWNIIQQIGEQAIGLDCVGTNYDYNNPPPTPTPNVFNYVESVTGLNTNNADPQNPVVRISVDGTTITGQGTPLSPLVVPIPPTIVESVTDDGNGVVIVDNSDPANPIVQFNGVNVDGVTILGNGSSGSPLEAVKQIALETNSTPNPTQNILNLVEGTGINITDDGSGNITIDSTVVGSQNLQEVTDVGNITTNNFASTDGANNKTIIGNGTIEITTGNTGNVSIDASASTNTYTALLPDKPAGTETFAMLSDITGSSVTSVTATLPITSSGGATPNISTLMKTNRLIGRTSSGNGEMEEITVGSGLTLSGGSLSATGGGGLKSGVAVASVTDVYTTTISGVTTYNINDAYIIKFNTANSDGATLNISGVGAVQLVKNNDVKITGGDISVGQEFIVIYDGTNFQMIGIAPNQMFAYVTNADSVTINKGQPVYAFGASGDRMSVKLANNTSEATSSKTVGLVFSSSIAPNGLGFVITQGVLSNVNTNAYSAGDTLYVGNTAGALTNTMPTAPNHLTRIGIVERANAGNGLIYVLVQNGFQLDELSDVDITSTLPVNNDVLTYVTGVNNLWKPRSISTILGYTPQATITGAATTITTSNLTASRALVSDGSGKVAVSSVTSTELGYVAGVTSAIQTQINNIFDDQDYLTVYSFKSTYNY
jgi:hypothetical protein